MSNSMLNFDWLKQVFFRYDQGGTKGTCGAAVKKDLDSKFYFCEAIASRDALCDAETGNYEFC